MLLCRRAITDLQTASVTGSNHDDQPISKGENEQAVLIVLKICFTADLPLNCPEQ